LKVIKDCLLKTFPLDFMPVSLIKDCSDIFAPLICRLANLSFTESIFPELFKVGQITPLIKKLGADASEPANYRPITNLNTIGKMLERLAQNQLRQHISTSPNYNTSQSAYRALHSTETAMTNVVNDRLTAVDSGKPTVLLSLDISAAFDMLDHDRLLNRAIELFGLSCQVINWLDSYLTSRTSYVFIGNCRTSTLNCSTGVTQGSVLGPLLFSIFTSPVSHLISSFNVLCHQYADDMQLYTSIDLSSDHDINILSDCTDAVTRWHLENNLLLNPSRTEVLITGTRQQVTKFESSTPAIQTIRFADTVIRYTKSVYIQGVTIDSHLTFDKHVSNVVQSCNYHVRSLRHIRKLIDKDTAATLVCSIVSSRLDYCSALLYGITSKNLN
jgi:Reverse transcriptase (RNA-dependent DNA polymerase)